MTPREWIFSHRCSRMVVYVFCHNAQSESHSDPHDICMLSLSYQLPNCNCLPNMLLFILLRDTTSELWTPVQFPLHCFTVYFYSLCWHSCITITFYHSIRSILCSQQTGETDNLIEVGSKVLGCVVCRFHVAARWRSSYVNYAPAFSGTIVRSVAKLASITFWSLAFSYWFDNLGFTTEGNLLLCSSYLPLGVPNWVP
jgi:hypothetical protein